MIRIILLFTLLGVSSASQALDSEGGYLIYPTGTIKCNELLVDNASGVISYTETGVFIPDVLAAYVGYIDGYLTAVNRTVAGKRDHFNEAIETDVMTWVTSYCRDNPKDNFNRAVHAYVDQFMTQEPGKLGPIELMGPE
jgi:hypothetical protein